VLFIGIWFFFQLLDGSASIAHPEAGGGVAFFAHIGGFLFGVLTIKLVQRQRPLAPRY
jgi:membrane associated rhomboid family serine protease